jgi:hypothetical protein
LILNKSLLLIIEKLHLDLLNLNVVDDDYVDAWEVDRGLERFETDDYVDYIERLKQVKIEASNNDFEKLSNLNKISVLFQQQADLRILTKDTDVDLLLADYLKVSSSALAEEYECNKNILINQT